MKPRQAAPTGGHLLAFVSLAIMTAAAAPALAQEGDGVAVDQQVKIPMRDGTHLVATVYRPAKVEQPLPVIFMMDPYGAGRYGKEGQWYAARGFVMVTVDVRGCGNSPGTFRPFETEGKDGYDAIEWLARQPYSNGKIGMFGGSYQGWVQWTVLKESPPHLKTIIPAVSTCPGTEGIPKNRNINLPYVMSWLHQVERNSGRPSLDGRLLHEKKCEMYRKHLPFAQFDSLHLGASPPFQTWMKHPAVDTYWDSLNPTAEQYARMNIPILTLTGHFDADQTGAMTHYRRHVQSASAEARKKHFVIIGPWDHQVYRAKGSAEFAGLTFGPASQIDITQLHLDWFNWALKDGPKPAFLEKNLAYYVMGEERWKFADSLETIPSSPRNWVLDSGEKGAPSLSAPGLLGDAPPRRAPSDTYTYDPLDTRPGEMEIELGGEPGSYNIMSTNALSQRYAQSASRFGHGLVYESPPLSEDTEISGYARLVAWISMDVPDTDFMVTVHEVRPDGTSIQLTDDALRARYRKSPRTATLAVPGEIAQYEFKAFWFFSRVLLKGSRVRLVFMSPNSIHLEKNYNGGGGVAEESAKDARRARITLHHDARHASFLELPVVPRGRR